VIQDEITPYTGMIMSPINRDLLVVIIAVVAGMAHLTIRGVTKSVTLSVGDVSEPFDDPWAHRLIGVSASEKVNRKDFGVVWNTALKSGGVLVATKWRSRWMCSSSTREARDFVGLRLLKRPARAEV
jgi:YceI-like domain